MRLIVGLSLFGAFIEVAQAIPMLHRDSDPLDWVADTVACALVVIAFDGGALEQVDPAECRSLAASSASAYPSGAYYRVVACNDGQPYCAVKMKRERMTQFDDRERAFETKFAHDEEMKFRITARRNRLLGEWAARQMGLSEAEAESYAKDVVRSDFEEAGEHDVIRKVLGDLTSAGVESDEEKVREALRNKEIEARRQIIESTNL